MSTKINNYSDMNTSTTPKSPKWTIIKALDYVLSQAKESKLSNKFWRTCKSALDYLEEKLGLTRQQIVFIAIMVEKGTAVSWRGFGEYLDCSRLNVMTYSEEIEALIPKGWIYRSSVREWGSCYKAFKLEYGVVTALRRNKTFKPNRIDGLNIQQFLDLLEDKIDKFNDHNADMEDKEEWLQYFCQANKHLPLCQEVLKFDDIHVASLLFIIIYDYLKHPFDPNTGVPYLEIDCAYPDYVTNQLRRALREGTHPLIVAEVIEQKCDGGYAGIGAYALTQQFKDEYLAGYVPDPIKREETTNPFENELKKHTEIQEKKLFYNDSDYLEIDRLSTLLSKDNLPNVQDRLEKAGMRKGVACLFYGAPGTGKTESVLQIARQTGRDIMQVDIASMRDKWVGESEKNIKAIFSRYRIACNRCEVLPILLFNEADALINKRTERVSHSVDKMENAMQNIILQEMENLEGILIATTNLTTNLDSAFERRFLFKVEFHQPEPQIKAKIWRSMIEGLSEADALHLAKRYDFSGGQIENISRKHTIGKILSGGSVSLADIEKYCQAEELHHKQLKKIGFC